MSATVSPPVDVGSSPCFSTDSVHFLSMSQQEFDRLAGRCPRLREAVWRPVIRLLKKRYVEPVRGWKSVKKTARGFLPIIDTIREYSWKKDLIRDAIGGLTVGFMHIPQGIAYASLAGVPAVVGLYASFFAPLFYMLFGTSRHVSVGTFAVVALMAGAVVREKACVDWELHAGKNCTEKQISYTPGEVASTLTFVIGVVQLCLGACGFSFVTAYFSDELVSGFTTGASVHVVTTQLKDLLGYHPPHLRDGHKFQVPIRWFQHAEDIGHTNFVTLSLSLVVLLMLAAGKYLINPLVQNRWNSPVPVPFELLVIIGGTVASHFFDLEQKHGVKTVGEIPTGMPMPALPRFGLFLELVPDAVSISVIVIAIHVSLAKIFAKQFKYPIETSQEFYALGLSSVLSGFFPVYPLSTSLSRTIVNSSAGTRSLLSAVFSSLLILGLCLFAGQYLKALPMCILAAIVVVALLSMYGKFLELKTLWKVSKLDMLIWLVSFLMTVIVDVVTGLIAAVAFALFTTVLRAQWANLTALGDFDGIYCDIKRYDFVEIIENVAVVRFNAPLIFTTVERFQGIVRKAIKVEEDEKEEEDSSSSSKSPRKGRRRVKALVLDCSPFVYSDAMGIRVLFELSGELKDQRIELFLAGAAEEFREMVEDFEDQKEELLLFFPNLERAINRATGLPSETISLFV